MAVRQLLIIWISLFCVQFSFAQNQLQSPDNFLPHHLGDAFTPHHLLVDYFQHVAQNSEQVLLRQYGKTNEDRPLMYAVISSKNNLEHLEEIRQNNLRRTGLVDGKSDDTNPVTIVWLSYGVHGNEAAASESSMAVIYQLANPNNPDVKEWLKNTVIILDPSINPDGYSRYTHWERRVTNKIPNPHTEASEHQEPWPGGRVNHYLFDLNRDWAWQTQVESQQRLDIYHQWMPHVHVDFHEMGFNDPYYFAPAARPYHQQITDWQRQFQTELGKNHAKYFDQKGWLYFTREVFDLFYPSYGDTYPTFHGAIGMTYEQGGGGRASRAVIMENGDTLRLKDRIDHHLTTSLSTIEWSSKSADKLVKNFSAYFADSQNKPTGEYKSFVIKGSNAPAKISRLCHFLDKHQIRYSATGKASAGLRGFNYQTGKETAFSLADGDLLISAYQPMGVLAQVLFEPNATIEDSLTYDITAWALPYAYGLEAFAVKQKLEIGKTFTIPASPVSESATETPYAFLANWESINNCRFLGALQQQKVNIRMATEAFSLEGKSLPAGTLVITRADNKQLGNDFQKIVTTTANRCEQKLTAVKTGFSESGFDLGSDKMRLLKAPKVLVVSGEKVFANDFGQVWHYFETELQYPLTIITADDLSGAVLDDYNLLIMPSGYYRLDASALSNVKKWVSAGGHVIAIEGALRNFENQEGFALTSFATEEEKSADKKEDEKEELDGRLHDYAHRERRSISKQMPGAIVKLRIDNTHPLGFGLPDYYFSLKTDTRSYKYLKNCWNVGTIEKEPMVVGFAGAGVKNKLAETTVFGVEEMGRGSVTYLVDNPLFRGFWEQGKFLFGNAVFLVGN